MSEIIEVQNNTTRRMMVSACRSKSSNRLYIHLGLAHGDEVEVKPLSYEEIEVKTVEY